MKTRVLEPGYEPYVWATQAAEVAERHGLDPAQVLRFDANVPPLPGVPLVPIGESFARLNEYPEGTYRELRRAAAGYTGVTPEQIVVGAGADDVIGLIAKTFLERGHRAAVTPPTYSLYAIASRLEGAQVVEQQAEADVIWLCNPNNPTGELVPAAEIAALARAHPDAIVAVDEAYYEYGGESVVPLLGEAPNMIAIRTLSKAFGLAALRVGYAVAAHDVAAELTARRAPGPIAAPSAAIAAAALRDPRLDVEEANAERERMRAALVAAGYDCPGGYGNFVYVRTADAQELKLELETKGLVVRSVAGGIRITIRVPAENDLVLAALGAAAEPAATRSALVIRSTAETSLRISLSLDGRGRARTQTGIGFLDHLLAQLAFHGGLDLEVLAGGDTDVDEHHTVEDVLAALGDALGIALGSRTGVGRYGSATVPMDEAKATATVDLVRRPHAEVALRFGGDRVGGLAVTLLPHALERFAMQAGLTMHVEGAGDDDHHVAEAAFKALGRALREACARDGAAPVRSTKGDL